MARVRLALILAHERANLSSHLLFALVHDSKRAKWPNVPSEVPGKAGDRGALAARVPACRGYLDWSVELSRCAAG